MRMMSIALMVLAIPIGVSDVTLAKSPKHATQTSQSTAKSPNRAVQTSRTPQISQTPGSCKGRNQAFENGTCVTTTRENPDHAPVTSLDAPF